MCNVALACSSELVSESDDFSEVHNLKVNVKAEYVYRCFYCYCDAWSSTKKQILMAVLLFSLPLWMHGAAMAFSSSLNVSDDVAETPGNWTSKLCRSSVFCSDPSIRRQPSTSWGLHPQTFGTVCNCVLSHCYPTHWNTVLDGSSSHLAGCLSSGLIPSTLLAADKQYEGTPRWPGETRRVTALVYCQTDCDCLYCTFTALDNLPVYLFPLDALHSTATLLKIWVEVGHGSRKVAS